MTHQTPLMRRLQAIFFNWDEVKDLLLMTESPDGYKRENAVRRLGLMGNPVALPQLLIRANDWVPQVRDAARGAIRLLATTQNAQAFVECLPEVYRLSGRHRDAHGPLISDIERYLLQPENISYVLNGIANDDKGTSTACALLVFERRLLNSQELVRIGLIHPDVTVRQKAAQLIGELEGDQRDAAIATALKNGFMPVRRAAMLLIMERAPKIEEIDFFLFDKHVAMRQLAAGYLQKREVQVDRRYREALSSTSVPNIRVGIWGLGEYGAQADLALVARFLKHGNPSLRKQALSSFAKLCDQDVDRTVLAGLSDEDAGVSKEAARIAVRKKQKLSASDIYKVFQASAAPHVVKSCVIALKCSNKWERLIFFLLLLEKDSHDDSYAMELIKQWDRDFNKSHAQPTARQIQTFKILLKENPGVLFRDSLRTIAFTFRELGITN